MYGIGIDLDHMIIWNKNYFNKNKFEETISSICLGQTEFKVEKDFDTIADIFNHLKRQYNSGNLQLIEFGNHDFNELKIIQVDKPTEINEHNSEDIFSMFEDLFLPKNENTNVLNNMTGTPAFLLNDPLPFIESLPEIVELDCKENEIEQMKEYIEWIEQELSKAGYPIPDSSETFTDYMTSAKIMDVKDAEDTYIWLLLCEYFCTKENLKRRQKKRG